MKVLRAIGWVVISGVLMAVAGGVTTRIFDQLWPPASSSGEGWQWVGSMAQEWVEGRSRRADGQRAEAEAQPREHTEARREQAEAHRADAGERRTAGVDPGNAERNDPTVPPNPTGNPFWGHCCVARSQLGLSRLMDLRHHLSERWPKLRTLSLDDIDTHDRVAFLVEVGSSPDSFAHELLTGTVVALEGEQMIVGLGCEPRHTCRHGLCCEGVTLVPRRAVLAWSAAADPERAVELDAIDDAPLVRHVAPGEPIELTVLDRPGSRWSVEPAGAAEVQVLEKSDNAATVALRPARPGPVTLTLTAPHEDWGTLQLGRWALQVESEVA